MKPGPKRLPATVRKHRGTYRADRGLPPEASKPTGRASRPELSPEARREWDRLAPYLHRLSLLTPVDRGVFRIGCEWYALAMDAARRLRVGQGKSAGYAARDGRLSVHFRAFREASGVYLRFADRFGLSPGARESLTAALRGALGESGRTEGGAGGESGESTGDSRGTAPTGTEGRGGGKVVLLKDRTGRPL